MSLEYQHEMHGLYGDRNNRLNKCISVFETVSFGNCFQQICLVIAAVDDVCIQSGVPPD